MRKNKQILDDFVAYCTAHPQERFWQALRNWSGYSYIYGRKVIDFETYDDIDTFYFKGRKK